MDRRKQYMAGVKRVVIKVGSSTLTHSNGLLNLSCMDSIVRQIADLHNSGMEVILVSSGAVAAGMGRLGLKARPKSMPQKQACAAIGQVALMHMYDKFFGEYGKTTAQILITREDMNHKHRLVNAKNTFSTLIRDKAIAIVNENDAIVTEELKIGDNDTLSAYVCKLVKGDLLILMSDIDGLYDCNPSTHAEAKLINYVESVTDNIACAAEGAGSKVGTGGMITKINAAKIVNEAGAAMVIVDGSTDNILNKVLEGDNVGTFFDCLERR